MPRHAAIAPSGTPTKNDKSGEWLLAVKNGIQAGSTNRSVEPDFDVAKRSTGNGGKHGG